MHCRSGRLGADVFFAVILALALYGLYYGVGSQDTAPHEFSRDARLRLFFDSRNESRTPLSTQTPPEITTSKSPVTLLSKGSY